MIRPVFRIQVITHLFTCQPCVIYKILILSSLYLKNSVYMTRLVCNDFFCLVISDSEYSIWISWFIYQCATSWEYIKYLTPGYFLAILWLYACYYISFTMGNSVFVLFIIHTGLTGVLTVGPPAAAVEFAGPHAGNRAHSITVWCHCNMINYFSKSMIRNYSYMFWLQWWFGLLV